MALDKALCGVLAAGAEKERAAHDFYTQAAAKTANALGKKMFGRLAEEEARHEQLLRSWALQGACPVNVKFPVHDKDFVARGREKAATAVKPQTTDLEAIELGQEMERKAIRFYEDGAGGASDAASRDLLLRLKAEEEKHLALLADLYEYMKDPGIWSVRDGGAHFDS